MTKTQEPAETVIAEFEAPEGAVHAVLENLYLVQAMLARVLVKQLQQEGATEAAARAEVLTQYGIEPTFEPALQDLMRQLAARWLA